MIIKTCRLCTQQDVITWSLAILVLGSPVAHYALTIIDPGRSN